jgi:hypothetical protein
MMWNKQARQRRSKYAIKQGSERDRKKMKEDALQRQ